MVSAKSLIVLATSVVAAVVPRDAAKIQSDLQTINSDTQALTKAINNYSGGGLAAALPVANAESTLDKAIKSATSDANSLSTVSDSDANAIIGYINQTLEPSIAGSIDAIIAKKAAFTSGGIAGIVSGDLKSLQSDAAALGKALVAKSPSGESSAASSAAAAVNAQLARGVAAYS